MNDHNLLFAYGSLVEGMAHFNKIANFVERITPASALGSVYRLRVGYPVFLNQGQNLVSGQLLQVQSSATLWLLLDEFHGFNQMHTEKSLFHRVELEVRDQSGPVKAYTYAINPQKLPKTATLIRDGDWRRSLAEQPVLTQSLTERQKTYIKRLGSSSGRDIVPIDLPLYRELINLELIVDKGRRLALTSLGLEVLRFLE